MGVFKLIMSLVGSTLRYQIPTCWSSSTAFLNKLKASCQSLPQLELLPYQHLPGWVSNLGICIFIPMHIIYIYIHDYICICNYSIMPQIGSSMTLGWLIRGSFRYSSAPLKQFFFVWVSKPHASFTMSVSNHPDEFMHTCMFAMITSIHLSSMRLETMGPHLMSSQNKNTCNKHLKKH